MLHLRSKATYLLAALFALTLAGCGDTDCDENLLAGGGGSPPQTLPTITATGATPQQLVFAGGTPVSISGVGFSNCGSGVGSSVQIQVGNQIVPGMIVSDTEIQFTAPAVTMAGTVDVAVLCPEGVITMPSAVTYDPPVPSLTLDKSAGCYDAGRPAGDEGTPVTATVADFTAPLTAGVTVTIGGVAATDVMVVDGTNVSFEVPSGLTPGAVVDVVVTDGADTATATGALTVCGAIAAGTIILNEWIVNPAGTVDSNGDGVANVTADEFVEFVNASALPVDIGGYIMADGGAAVRHRFLPGTILQPGAAIVVFGGGTPVGFPVGVVQVAVGATLSFSNASGGDEVIFRTPDGATELINYHYRGSGEVGGQEWVAGVSLQNINEGNLALAPVYDQHNLVAGAVGVASPGRKVDGTDFP